MALILDTNALLSLAYGDLALRRAIEHEQDPALPAIVLGEYLFGIRQSRFRPSYEAWLRSHRAVFVMLSVEAETAEHYAAIRSELKSAGQPIPTNDLWIAALSREHGYALLSWDKHFAAVLGFDRQKRGAEEPAALANSIDQVSSEN
jgi:tRNA(fMet)-specific endonuclease VapC